MGDDQEFAAVGSDEIVPELIVKEGEDIDYRVVMVFYLLADLAFVICFIFAYEEGYWVTTLPFLPLTIWMAYKVYQQQAKRALEEKKNGIDGAAEASSDKKSSDKKRESKKTK